MNEVDINSLLTHLVLVNSNYEQYLADEVNLVKENCDEDKRYNLLLLLLIPPIIVLISVIYFYFKKSNSKKKPFYMPVQILEL
jgi:hypothetical protein